MYIDHSHTYFTPPFSLPSPFTPFFPINLSKVFMSTSFVLWHTMTNQDCLCVHGFEAIHWSLVGSAVGTQWETLVSALRASIGRQNFRSKGLGLFGEPLYLLWLTADSASLQGIQMACPQRPSNVLCHHQVPAGVRSPIKRLTHNPSFLNLSVLSVFSDFFFLCPSQPSWICSHPSDCLHVQSPASIHFQALTPISLPHNKISLYQTCCML